MLPRPSNPIWPARREVVSSTTFGSRSPETPTTYPDVFATCDERDRGADAKLTKRYPTFICEVVSPNTAAYDLGEKFEHYQQSESLREVLFIDP